PAPVPDETGPREPASDEAPPGDAASPAPTSPLVALVRAPIEASVSVVIPTKNGEAEGVGRCLKALRTQAGLRQPPELVVVDSGSTDRTRELAADAGARVMEIAPEDFDHGGTRNLGADHARGDVILFTVQDAVAASETLVADLVAMLLEDGDLAVVSARQIPRADADHFAAWQLWHHYRVLGDETRLTSAAQAARLAELRGEGLWRAALVDDVCAAHRADAFRALRYRPMRFGEDVDYGLRCLRAGRGLGFYADSGVIHSHRRSAAYQLRSHYVVRETLAPLLEPPDGARFAAAGVRRFDDLRASGLDAYRRLARAASTLAPDRPHDPRRALATLATRLRARDGAAPSPAEGDASLDALLPEVVNGVGSVDPGRASPLVRDAVADALEQLALPFLAPCFERMDGAEIAGFAYKTYGMVFGGALGDWSRSAPDAERAALEALDERLVAGVVR
ncbi:MAG TPA: glycosyltransferase, partial [Sandaracinaceae bacterium LLY-WYZ-13_1]|nr:glycosyltransferase [Sandaracinaceae bacterium LLY-WYZ-13_1]